MLLPRFVFVAIGNGSSRARETVPSVSKTTVADRLVLGDTTHENMRVPHSKLLGRIDQAVYAAGNLLHSVHQARKLDTISHACTVKALNLDRAPSCTTVVLDASVCTKQQRS
jgi:hypothetical protein